MSSRMYFAWRMAAEAEKAERLERKRQELRIRREDLSAESISDTHFVQRYRLSKEAYHYVCDTLRAHTDLKSSQRVSLESKVLCALLFYANGDYQRVSGIANHLSQEAASRYIDEEATEALNHPEVIRKHIKFPSTPDARNIAKQKFYNMHKIPGVLGCIDGCHFRIFKPHKDTEHLFYCRKHYHSLNVQMVADHECRILSVNAKFGGASHDAFVWKNSDMNSLMQSLHRNRESVWLLGDSGYPQRPWLMTPYNNPAPGSAAESYNAAHSRGRVIIENTFGRLKNQWRCTCKDRVLHYKTEKCAKIILACCVLHNISLDFRVQCPENEINSEQFHRMETPLQQDQTLLTLERLARDRLANIIHAAAV